MQAITPDDLAEWLESQQPLDDLDPDYAAEYARYAEYAKREAAEIATLPATQRLAFLVHIGELGDECPRCHTRYVELSRFEYPDYVGETVGTTWECCGHTESYSTGLEYRNGRVVDVR